MRKKPVTILQSQIKALSLCCSKPNDFESFVPVFVDCDKEGVTLVATDAHVMLRVERVDWGELKATILQDKEVRLPDKPTTGRLYLDDKARKSLQNVAVWEEGRGSYPRYENIIPDYTEPVRLDDLPRSYYSFDILARVAKIHKALGLDSDCWAPHFQNDSNSAGVCWYDTVTLLVMPLNYKRLAGYREVAE